MRQSQRALRTWVAVIARVVSLAVLVLFSVQAARSYYGRGFQNAVLGNNIAAFFNGANGRLSFGLTFGRRSFQGATISVRTRPEVRFLGMNFEVITVTTANQVAARQVSASLYAWQGIVLSAVLPLVWFVRRWGRELNGGEYACAACGYDLCATPDRCPECGGVPDRPYS